MNFLYWIYLWQLKEYRRDRMRLYLQGLSWSELLREYLLGKVRRPRLTVKVLLLSIGSFLLMVLAGGGLTALGAGWILSVLLVLFTIPVWITLAVGGLAIPSWLITQFYVHQALSKRRRFADLIVIGVTGSYGKTTTKEAIAAMLSEKYNVLKTRGGVNTKFAIAKQILRELDASVEVYVVEIGAYKKGEIAELARLVKPRIGVLTGINEQHLGLFGSLANIIEAKFELIESLPANGVAVLNVADQNVAREQGRVKVTRLEYESTRPDQNVAAAIKVAQYLGLNEQEIEDGKQKIAPVDNRLQIKLTKGSPTRERFGGAGPDLMKRGSLTLIDDTYNSNPAGFRAALDELKSLDAEQKILVTTGIYELGEMSEKINRELSKYASKICGQVFVVDSVNARYFGNAELVNDPGDLLDRIRRLITNQSGAVLFEGRNRVINVVLSKLENE